MIRIQHSFTNLILHLINRFWIKPPSDRLLWKNVLRNGIISTIRAICRPQWRNYDSCRRCPIITKRIRKKFFLLTLFPVRRENRRRFHNTARVLLRCPSKFNSFICYNQSLARVPASPVDFIRRYRRGGDEEPIYFIYRNIISICPYFCL